MTPSHTTRNGRKYRYYISHANNMDETPDHERWRLKATDVEACVVNAVQQWLGSSDAVAEVAGAILSAPVTNGVAAALTKQKGYIGSCSKEAVIAYVAASVERIDVDDVSISITASPALMLGKAIAPDKLNQSCKITSPVRLKRRGTELRLILGETGSTGEVDTAAVALIQRAHRWRKKWMEDDTLDLARIASFDGADQSDASKQIRLAFLAPDIVDAILGGTAPVDLTTERLRRLLDLPVSWQAQRQLLGFS